MAINFKESSLILKQCIRRVKFDPTVFLNVFSPEDENRTHYERNLLMALWRKNCFVSGIMIQVNTHSIQTYK